MAKLRRRAESTLRHAELSCRRSSRIGRYRRGAPSPATTRQTVTSRRRATRHGKIFCASSNNAGIFLRRSETTQNVFIDRSYDRLGFSETGRQVRNHLYWYHPTPRRRRTTDGSRNQ